MPINWKDYPPLWKEKIRPSVLMRDDFKCVRCGVKHGDSIVREKKGVFRVLNYTEVCERLLNKLKVVKIVLSVHHVCEDKMCEDISHMESLCQRCHVNADKKMHRIKRMQSSRNKLKMLYIPFPQNPPSNA